MIGSLCEISLSKLRVTMRRLAAGQQCTAGKLILNSLLQQLNQCFQVSGVAGFSKSLDLNFKASPVDPALTPGNFLQARDLQSLPAFNDTYELGGIDQ